ncbi:MAG: hypothetical protein MJK18_09605 [Bdellovibrionales bacterium]|nr:hypothetical protein [Bdellovibrionales bacterium]
MTKLDTFIAIVALSISTTFLFQNCSEPTSSTSTSASINFQDNESSAQPFSPERQPTNIDVQTESNVVLINNRDFGLDNKAGAGMGSLSFELVSGNVVAYETTYKAVQQSTVVYIEARSNGSLALRVVSDFCMDKIELRGEDINRFLAILNGVLSLAAEDIYVKTDAATSTQCAFPRFVVNSMNQPDYDLYFAQENCVPSNELFVQGNNRSARETEMELLFIPRIDSICGL